MIINVKHLLKRLTRHSRLLDTIVFIAKPPVRYIFEILFLEYHVESIVRNFEL